MIQSIFLLCHNLYVLLSHLHLQLHPQLVGDDPCAQFLLLVAPFLITEMDDSRQLVAIPSMAEHVELQGLNLSAALPCDPWVS
jgi:hypothetical protein